MPRSEHNNWTISSVQSGHLRSVICGQPTSALTYKGQDGVWKNSESFGLADLDALVAVAQQAKLWVTERSGR